MWVHVCCWYCSHQLDQSYWYYSRPDTIWCAGTIQENMVLMKRLTRKAFSALLLVLTAAVCWCTAVCAVENTSFPHRSLSSSTTSSANWWSAEPVWVWGRQLVIYTCTNTWQSLSLPEYTHTHTNTHVHNNNNNDCTHTRWDEVTCTCISAQ